MNINKLKGRIKEMELTQELLAEEIGINKSTLYRKFKSNGESFELWEIHKIVNFLQLTDIEVKDIFFNNKSA